MPVNANILLIGGSAEVRLRVRAALTKIGQGAFALESASRLSDGIERLTSVGVDAVLVSLTLPDCQGIETLNRLLLAAPHVPILILANSEDANLAREVLDKLKKRPTFLD